MTLPVGFTIRIADAVLRADQGRLLVGGSPLAALRLNDKASALLRDGWLAVTDNATARLAERLLATNIGQPDLHDLPPIDRDDLTVVLPARDRADQLDRTLATLSPARCIVVDDASTRPGAIAAVAERHGAQLVGLTANLGPAGARNSGLAKVSTPYVAFVDCDVQVRLADLLQLSRHFADPSVCLVAPRIEGLSTRQSPQWFERYDTIASSLTLGRVPCSVRPGAAVSWLPSACLVGRTADLGPGFDAAMRVGEDVDLVWRLVDQGRRVRYDPGVIAYHETRSTLRGWLGRKFVYGSGGADLAARHGNRLAPAVLSPTYAVAAAAVLTRSRWSLPAAAVALAVGTRAVRGTLPDTPGGTALAAIIATRGLGWAIRQESALLLRHWWPAAAAAAVPSRLTRRALATALIVDTAVALHETRTDAPGRQLAVIAAGRRLDDLAYGSGLWWGAVQARSVKVLRPRRPSS